MTSVNCSLMQPRLLQLTIIRYFRWTLHQDKIIHKKAVQHPNIVIILYKLSSTIFTAIMLKLAPWHLILYFFIVIVNYIIIIEHSPLGGNRTPWEKLQEVLNMSLLCRKIYVKKYSFGYYMFFLPNIFLFLLPTVHTINVFLMRFWKK